MSTEGERLRGVKEGFDSDKCKCVFCRSPQYICFLLCSAAEISLENVCVYLRARVFVCVHALW